MKKRRQHRNVIPTTTATLAQVRRGRKVRLGGKYWEVGGRPRPGFVMLDDGNEQRAVRLRTKVDLVTSGKLVPA